MTVVYDNQSPYKNTDQITVNGVSYLDFWKGIVITPNSADQYLVLTSQYQYRPDKLSWDYYQTPKLWWVFSLRNPDVLIDPIWDMTSGVGIWIPAKAALSGYL